MALPGSGHLMRSRLTVGVVWTVVSLAFYGALILFRVAADANLYRVTVIAALLMSCAAVYDCCLRGTQYPAVRKLGFFALALLASVIWANAICNWCSLAAGFRYMQSVSRSMEPTIPVNTRILVDSRYYEHHKPQDGDVVMVDRPVQHIYVIKRICGIGGETVQISSGKLIRNGAPVEEPYIIHERRNVEPNDPGYSMPARTIPPSELFLLGDNRDNSFDSRYPEAGKFYDIELRGKVVRIAKLF